LTLNAPTQQPAFGTPLLIHRKRTAVPYSHRLTRLINLDHGDHMPAKFVLNKGRNGQFYFTLLATNGRTIAASEMYNTRAAALNGIASIQKNAASARLDDNTATTTPAKKAATKKTTAAKKTARPRAARKTVPPPPASPAEAGRPIATKAAAAVSDTADAVTNRIDSTAPDAAQT
jgi:uncharacterized protein